ncbi:MAG: sigma-54 dependent transcriptional regulator [Desulfobacter sp.]
MQTPDIFIVDDDKSMRQSTRQWLELAGYRVRDFDRAAKVLDMVGRDMNAIIISDVKMPKMDGIAFQKALAEVDPDIPVILITAHGDISMAVEAIRNGAYDFLEKPFAPERILDSVQRAVEKRGLVMENRELRRQLNAAQGLDARLVGGNPRMRGLKQQIMGIAPTEATIMIIGETGTGKEVVARCLHDWSKRREQPFLAVNCAAIPATMAESELFGYEAGAFTGANQRHQGKLEAAAKGTLFLDELSSMPLEVQGKLLRALESMRVTRLGSNTPVPLDFRLITAMNITPDEAIASQKLRKDLYYRLNTMELTIPALRERKEDITSLFSLFLERAAEMYDCRPDMPGPAGYSALMAHDWPGNVRELKSVAERYVLSNLAGEERLSRLLDPDTEGRATLGGTALAEQVRHFERHLIKDALKRHNGQINKVIAELDTPRRTLNEKMARYGLSRNGI